MKITAETTRYRPTITDPATGKKVKFSFPLHGSIRDKQKTVKEIDNYIFMQKLEAKKMEAKILILEAEATRRALHSHDINIITTIKNCRKKERVNPLNELFERYKSTEAYKRVSAITQYQRENHFNKLVIFMESKNIIDVDQLNADCIALFMDSLVAKASTFNKYINNLSSVFKALELENYLANIKRKNEESDVKIKIPFTDDEIKLIFANFTGDWLEICKIATYTGLRFIDVIHLNKSSIVLDFNKKEHILKITPAKTSHTGRSLHIQLVDELKFLLTKETDSNGYFFSVKVKQYKAGTKHAGSSLNHVFMKKIKAISIKDKSFHCFRHRFVDTLRKAGFSDEQIGSVVGHSSTKQTKDYGDYHNILDLNAKLSN